MRVANGIDARGVKGPGRPALLACAALVFSACAAGGMNEAASQGDAPPPAQAAKAEERRPASAGVQRPWAGWFSPLATIAYIPLKMLPCSLGAAGSAVGFLFTLDARMLRDTVTLNCGGDWIITPGMLEGTVPFQSVGRIEEQPGAAAAAPPAPPPTSVAPPLAEPKIE